MDIVTILYYIYIYVYIYGWRNYKNKDRYVEEDDSIQILNIISIDEHAYLL